MERLFHLIIDSDEAAPWIPIRIGTHGPPISHFMFADDLDNFCKASGRSEGEFF